MKFLALVIALTSFSAFAQTSSRFRNEVNNNVAEHSARIRKVCEAEANRKYEAQTEWLYKYEVKFLNDCYFSVKMTLMSNHIKQLSARIARLDRQAKDRRDAALAKDVASLRKGLAAFTLRQTTERTQFKKQDYGWMGMDDITKILLREINKVLVEYYESKAEMRYE